MKSKGRRFRELLEAPEIVVAPGIYDGFSARIVAAAGFKAATVSGAGVSESHLGWADKGIMGFQENLQACRAIAACAASSASTTCSSVTSRAPASTITRPSLLPATTRSSLLSLRWANVGLITY